MLFMLVKTIEVLFAPRAYIYESPEKKGDYFSHNPSIISQAMVLVSVELELVIVKLVPADLAVTLTNPGVPPSALDVRNIILLEVTVVFATTADPADSAVVPSLQL